MDATVTFTRGEHVAAAVGGEVFLVDPNDGEAFRLGGSGPRMWDLLIDGCSIEQVAATVARETGGSAKVVQAGVVRLAEQLVEIGALTPAVDDAS